LGGEISYTIREQNSAGNEEDVIGAGFHERAIIDVARFMNKMSKKASGKHA
jgi:predicted thioesterase